MIAAKKKKIRGRHFHHIRVNRLPTKACLRRGHSGFEQRHLSNSGRTAALADRLGVNLLNNFDGKMVKRPLELLAHANRRIVRA